MNNEITKEQIFDLLKEMREEYKADDAIREACAVNYALSRIKDLFETDDFPNCAISGCEAADAVCHLTCPYSKELADLKRDATARCEAAGFKVYIYAMEYDEDGTPYFAFTFDEELVKEAKDIWDNGEVLMGCYDEFAFGNAYEEKLSDICRTIIYRYEYERKQKK